MITVINATATGGASGGVTTGALNTTGANFFVVSICSLGSVAAPSATDSFGMTWTQLSAQNAGSTARNQLWYASGTGGAGHTFSALQVGSFASIAVLAVSGVGMSFDQQNGSATVGSAATTNPGTVTPTTPGQLVVTGMTLSVNAAASGVSGYTMHAVAAASGVRMGGGLAYAIQTSIASTNPTWAHDAVGNRAATIATFKEQDGGSSSGPFPAALATPQSVVMAKLLGLL